MPNVCVRGRERESKRERKGEREREKAILYHISRVLALLTLQHSHSRKLVDFLVKNRKKYFGSLSQQN